MAATTVLQSGASHRLVLARYSRQSLAERYPSEYSNRWRDRREKACILKCLQAIPRGGRVLDLPCGTGRLTRTLVELGYRVTAADVSEAMLSRARANYRAYQDQRGGDAPPVRFQISDVLSTGFADDEFDGVSCIRLFHHFAESETRCRALCELGRISRGPIVVTFLNSFALDRISYWLKDHLRGRQPTPQRPIAFNTFASDIDAAGLWIVQSRALNWAVSSRWILILSRR